VGDGVGGQPIPARPVGSGLPFLPAGPVGQPLLQLDALSWAVFGQREPYLDTDRGGGLRIGCVDELQQVAETIVAYPVPRRSQPGGEVAPVH
jgi:hypothetical protein